MTSSLVIPPLYADLHTASSGSGNALTHAACEENADMQTKKRGIREVLAANLQARMDADETISNQPLLSARSGVDQGYISRVLRQEAAVSIEVLEKLARGCRCQPWELLVDEEATREAAIRRMLGKDAA